MCEENIKKDGEKRKTQQIKRSKLKPPQKSIQRV